MVRIALIAECEHSAEIGRLLAEAGYHVTFVADDKALDHGARVAMHVTSERSRSGITELAPTEAPTDEQNLREEALHRESQKMEAIARLAGGIAHDFNNILSVIAICTDEVVESTQPSGAARACLEDIRHAVERGASVTRDLLAFSRRDVQDPRPVDFNEIVTSCHRMVERILGDDIQIETTLAADDSCVRIDSSHWASVFVNLALNARTAMPQGGLLKLGTRHVTIDPSERGRNRPKGSYVELEVTDTGCGMPDDVQTRIFEPFFTTKGLGKASGLGLSVVFGVVEQSGGWIEVTSAVGVGTTFRIYVPSAIETPVVESHSRPTLPKAPEAAVLVVEDEDPVRRHAVRALERSGYRVFQAASAEEALAAFAAAGTIDLLVTDIVLPGMNGRRLAETLSKGAPDLAVLYTSGYTDDEIVRSGASNAELFFLQKPYSTKLLVQRVEEVLATTKSNRALLG